ncbi:hypothetical protein, partial [uncultured Mitsuokella sp.]|uniref:hypothetical protein n=1 Tax=uncultured Mitsuokella sp. TaxID=453120 RepID=UPI0026745A3A
TSRDYVILLCLKSCKLLLVNIKIRNAFIKSELYVQESSCTCSSLLLFLYIVHQSELPVDADIALPLLVPVTAKGALEVAVEGGAIIT